MREILFRCSSLGRLMTEPKSAKDGPLSAGAKSYIRELALQEILGAESEFSSRETDKGIEVEGESIALLNRVRGLQLAKNTERRSDDLITGECDLYDAARRRGHDLKSSWSTKTFPGWPEDCSNALYEWQMRGYMRLWEADSWEVNYALVSTPERLIGYEPLQMHIVDHIPEHLRLTTISIERCPGKERAIEAKVRAARDYYAQMVYEFDRLHALDGAMSPPSAQTKPIAPPITGAAKVALPELF